MKNTILPVVCGCLLVVGGYVFGIHHATVALAASLIFEDKDGTIRFVSMNGMKEGQLERYDQTPTHGGIPRAYGHLIAAVVNPKGTGLVFEDAKGVIRFLTVDGKVEGELVRN